MEFLAWLLAVNGFVVAFNAIRKGFKEEARKDAEERRSKNTPCRFSDGLSEDEFRRIVMRVAKPFRRLTVLFVDGPLVRCRVRTQSGINEWDFEVDFNDHGHITGNYWFDRIDNESENVYIHKSFAERIRSEIEGCDLSKR